MTKTRVSVSIVTAFELPAISICWLLPEALNKTQLGTQYSVPTEHINLHSSVDNMTVTELFDHSYATESLLAEEDACGIRKPSSLAWERNTLRCLDSLLIEKYIHRYFMCYKITYQDHSEIFQSSDVAFTPDHPGMFRKYFLNDIFLKNTLYSVYVHTYNSSDLFDSILATEEIIDFHIFNVVNIFFSPTRLYRRPPPYDTKCKDAPKLRNSTSISSTFSEYLYNKLNQQAMEELKLVHTLEHVYDRYNYPLLTPGRMLNRTLHDRFVKMKDNIGIFEPACTLVYNVPRTTQQKRDRLSFNINWPHDSAIEVNTIASQEIMDFIIYVCSAVGIWFGLSIFSMMSLAEQSIHAKISPIVEQTESTPNIRCYIALRAKVSILEKQVRKSDAEILKLRRFSSDAFI